MAGTIKTNQKSSNNYYNKSKDKKRNDWLRATKSLLPHGQLKDAKEAHSFYVSYGGTILFSNLKSKHYPKK